MRNFITNLVAIGRNRSIVKKICCNHCEIIAYCNNMTTLIEETTLGTRLLPRIVLIACGSFSPPTLMHFRMFEIARDHFELQGTHQVVGGIVSPTHDAYGKKGLVPAQHRCSMVKLALQTSKWIRLSDWETQQNEWSRTLSVLQYHQNFINNYIKSAKSGTQDDGGVLPGWLPPGIRERHDPVQLRLLCGADLLESFAVPGLWADADIEDIIGNHGLVVISRSGANPEKFIFDSDLLTKHQRNITLVTNWVSNDVSSTMIRRLVARGMSVKYLIDDFVLDYIKKNRLFNWKSKYITHAVVYPPMHLVFNDEYVNQVHLKVNNDNSNKNDNNYTNNAAGSSESIVETPIDPSDEERMDETDFDMKNILNSFQLNNRTKVFCCGDKDKTGTKLLLNRSGPGQAVRTVITRETGSSKAHLREGEELKPKKMKITTPEHV